MKNISTNYPEWNDSGNEPDQTKKDNGWDPGEKPPADFFDWFFNQVYQSFQNVDAGIAQRLSDLLVNGIIEGGDVTENSTPDLNVLVNTLVGYNTSGARIDLESQGTVDLSSYLPTTTDYEKWVSLYIDVIDQDTNTEFNVVEGTEASAGSATKPNIDNSQGVLLADILLTEGQTAINNKNIFENRKQKAQINITADLLSTLNDNLNFKNKNIINHPAISPPQLPSLNLTDDESPIKWGSVNADSKLQIPTYADGSFTDDYQAIHPDVLFFPEKWNGYHYWMAFTPYPESSADYENPSIVASNDGVNWEVPSGLTNPVIEYPFKGALSSSNILNDVSNNGHLSDTSLVMGYDGKMYMVFRSAEYINDDSYRIQRVHIIESEDGINWDSFEESEVIIEESTDVSEYDAFDLSPSIVKMDGEYWLYSVCNTSTTNDSEIRLRKSDHPKGNWSSYEVISMPTTSTRLSEYSNTYYHWHMNVKKYQNQFYMVSSMRTDDTAESNNRLVMGFSNDGYNWELSKDFVLMPTESGWDDKSIYQSTIIPAFSGNTLGFRLYYSAQNSSGIWGTGLTALKSMDIVLSGENPQIELKNPKAGLNYKFANSPDGNFYLVIPGQAIIFSTTYSEDGSGDPEYSNIYFKSPTDGEIMLGLRAGTIDSYFFKNPKNGYNIMRMNYDATNNNIEFYNPQDDTKVAELDLGVGDLYLAGTVNANYTF